MRRLRSTVPAALNKPVPRRTRLLGSGTGLGAVASASSVKLTNRPFSVKIRLPGVFVKPVSETIPLIVTAPPEEPTGAVRPVKLVAVKFRTLDPIVIVKMLPGVVVLKGLNVIWLVAA